MIEPIAAPQPVTLTGTYVTLEPLSHAHASEIASAARAEWFDLYSQDCIAPVDQASATAYVDEALAGQQRGEYLPFVVRTARGEFAGCTRFADIDRVTRSIEIGWTWYVESARGTVVNPETKLLLMTHAFETLGLNRVYLKTSAFNEHSQNAIRKLGAVYEGTLRHTGIQRDGRMRNTVYFSVLASEWPAVREGLIARLD